ncbi:MAG: hypothetical protein IPI49_24945 [Myxococcales bacterium]|nr:hypothetical protein [Myxococcales bacterium]HRC58442.1 hypothetical protein [Kofleriaceae bacterium]
MIRLVLALSCVALVSCLESHGKTQELRGADCAVCHLPEYQATTAPAHGPTAANFPTTCGDCHLRLDWRPALEGRHPAEDVFPIRSGAHAQAACLTCHALARGRSSKGANTDCVTCHPNSADLSNAHVGAASSTGVPYRYQGEVANFCLTCHPKGTALKHPNDKFPRTGEHNVDCTTCHDRRTGVDTKGANTTCVESGCHHTVAWSDGKHREVRNYTSSRTGPWTQPHITARNFCLLCHQNGRD